MLLSLPVHLLATSLLLCSLTTALAQQDIAIVKSNLVLNGTNTFVAHDTNSFFTVAGRVTTPFLSFSETTEIFIQDTSAGIRVRSVPGVFDLETNSAAFSPGVEVTVFGTIKQSFGERSIRPEFYQGTDNDYENPTYDFYISDTNPVPVVPQTTTIDNLLVNGEELEGRLIRIDGVGIDSTVWPYQDDSPHTITDSTGSLTFFIDQDTDVDGQLPPTNTFDVVGVVAQFSTDTIPSNGYEIIPRYYTDVIQSVGQEPPSILAPSNVTSIVNVELQVNVVGRDRNAADLLFLSSTQSPPASTFTDKGNREGVLLWTPSLGDVGTTNEVYFDVTDGNLTNSALTRVLVRRASGGPGFAWLNEFHYDNTSGDVDEGVEVAGQAGIDLSSYYLLLYNGNDGNHYSSNNLSGTIDDEGNGYGAVWFPISGIQNGKGGDGTGVADGIALVHTANGLLQFLSYEGIFTANNGDAAGIASVDVGVEEAGDTAVGLSLGLVGAGTNYEDFVWEGPFAATPGNLNGATQNVGGVVDADVLLSNLRLDPTFPQTNQGFNIAVDAVANSSASALALTAYYSLDAGPTNSIAMAPVGGNTYRTTSMVPGQPDNTVVDYYACATFSGPGSNSPKYSETNSYTILASATGIVHAFINEIRADGAGTETNEFIEIIAPAGTDLQNVFIVHYNGASGVQGELFRFTFPNFVVPDDGITDTNGSALGFAVIGQNDGAVSNQDFTYSGSLQNGPDGLVLYDRETNVIDAVAWAGAGDLPDADPGTVTTSPPPTAPNYLHVTIDDSNADTSLQATNNVRGDPGSGWFLADETPGTINLGQQSGMIDITGGEGPPPPTNQPPVILPIGNLSVTISNALDFEVLATDLTDNDTIMLSASNLPPSATFPDVMADGAVTGSFSWASSEPIGVYTTRFYAADKDGVTTQEITITVSEVPGSGDCALIISEYIEGSSNNKALELYNGTDATIDFTAGNYALAGHSNGKSPPGDSPDWTHSLTGALASGETYVLVNTTAGDAGLLAAANDFGSLFFNGNDAILLYLGGVGGTVVDSFGQLGSDPGSAGWGSTTNFTKEHTMTRKSTVKDGDLIPDDVFDPELEWDFWPQDDFSFLGAHTSVCPDGGGNPDLDMDGIPDAWEDIYCSGDCDPPTDPTGDGDEFSWVQEYLLDYDPTVSNASFEFQSVAFGSFDVTFGETTNSRVYTVDYSEDLPAGEAGWTVLQGSVPGGAGTTTTVTDPADATNRAYRVRVHVP